ncbi:MAG: putative motility protein [Lachnospiraceae bacterium]|nr:putative motility protein [Lachnospiraceae bacterium]MBR3769168.1 YjfB family protein [Lachnospiraceae bacterium]
MDIAALSSAMALGQTQSAWGMKMLSNAMDISEIQGEQMAEMIASVPASQMELSVNPFVGGNFDMRV